MSSKVSEQQLGVFEPRDHFLLQWYTIVSLTVFCILSSKIVVKWKLALTPHPLFSKVKTFVMTIIEAYLAYQIAQVTFQNYSVEDMCQFFTMSSTNYLVYMAYLLTVAQVLIDLGFLNHFVK